MNVFDHKDLGNHLLKLCHKVVKHPVYIYDVQRLRVKSSVTASWMSAAFTKWSPFNFIFNFRNRKHSGGDKSG
jgi:hypothetical protein